MVDASFHGRVGYLLSAKETTWNTAVTPSKDIGIVQTWTPNFSNSFIERYSPSANAAQQITSGEVDITGSCNLLFQHGRVLEYLIGSVSHALTGSDTRHTFTVADDLPSMTVEEGYNSTGTDVVKRWAGVRMVSGTLDVSLGDVVKFDFNWLAGTMADSSTTQAAVISTLPLFRPVQATLTFGAAGSEVTINDVQNFKFTVNNYGGSQKLYGLTSRLPTAAEANMRSIKFSFTAGFRNITAWERVLGSTSPLNTGAEITASGLIMDINNGVTLGSGRRDIYIDLSGCQVNTYGKPMVFNDYVYQEFEGVATTIDSMFSTDNISSANF